MATVGILMGSRSDLPVMKAAATALDGLKISYEVRVLSAHRTPDAALKYASEARGRGLKVLIAGAGAAAHLAGVLAAKSSLPVLGVPLAGTPLQGLDALLSTVQMPGGVPVATLAVGSAGAKNAALMAARILALSDEALAGRVDALIAKQTADKLADSEVTAEQLREA